ncbi:MAG: hypothetical protein GXO37_08045 [Chloroflexi bacterium]|nr:hypothetical protein [Chloroflexota bacterium]
MKDLKSYLGLLVYPLGFQVWLTFSAAILLSIKSRSLPARLLLYSIPLYLAFELLSVVVHLGALLKERYDWANILLAVNVAGLVGYIAFVLVAINLVLHR